MNGLTDIDLKPELKLIPVRCWTCSRFYAHEKTEPARCPHCAEDLVEAKDAEIKTLKRANAALRGHVGRAAK